MRSALAAVVAVMAMVAGLSYSPAVTHRIEEDEPGWSCRVDGNQVCGPTNDEGVDPGCYEHGLLVAAWPCMGEEN